MKFSYSLKFITTVGTTFLFSSCAHYTSNIRPITRNDNPTPSQQINNYKHASQKRELDGVIGGRESDAPSFLKDVKKKKEKEKLPTQLLKIKKWICG